MRLSKQHSIQQVFCLQFWLINAFILMFVVNPVFAQALSTTIDDLPPLTLIAEGDVWRWTLAGNQLDRLTDEGRVRGAKLSPDGMYVALNLIMKEAIGQDFGDGAAPNELWILDLVTDELSLISGQHGSDPVTYSRPAWSPDGTSMAWTELQFPNLDLVIRELATNSQTRHPLTLDRVGYPMALPLAWGKPGIAVVRPGDMVESGSISVHDTDGRELWSSDLTMTGPNPPTWVAFSRPGSDEIAGYLVAIEQSFNFGDWFNEDGSPVDGTIYGAVQISSTTPESSVVLTMGGPLSPFEWGIRLNNDSDYIGIANFVFGDVLNWPISPDGRAVASIAFEHRNGDAMEVEVVLSTSLTDLNAVESHQFNLPLSLDHTTQLLWGPTTWRTTIHPN